MVYKKKKLSQFSPKYIWGCGIALFLFIILIFKACNILSIKQDATIAIREGSSLSKVSRTLEIQKLISSSFIFRAYAKYWRTINGCAIMHLGEYNLHKNESFSSILDKLCNGKSIMKSITFPEGLETREIMEMINKNIDLVGRKIIFFEEGKLLPETYHFKSGTDREKLFEKIRSDADEFINKEWGNREVNEFIKTPEDAIILASIIEKEAKTDDERAIIASVYLNRLSIKMRLEADPTTIYEITRGKYKMDRLLTRKDLEIKGNYNTYRKYGLPIAPICNPGKKSIYAVLHPAKTDYLYFVAKEDLTGHYFATNYKDHLKNIKFVKNQNVKK